MRRAVVVATLAALVPSTAAFIVGATQERLGVRVSACHCSLTATCRRRVASNPILLRMQVDGGGVMDDLEYETERLSRDAEAMAQMQQVMQRATSSATAEPEEGSLRNPWKWVIRKRVWDFMEDNNIARPPRPVHHRIPNFNGAEAAAEKLCSLPEFEAARVVKVNPDSPQKAVRFGVLSAGKTLMAPQPRLRTGFFSTLRPDAIPDGKMKEACTSVGFAKVGTPLDLEDKIGVDLIVVGSTAVCPTTGARIGKGEGFAELEYGMLRWMGAVSEKTLVVTTVEDCQVVADIPCGELMKHDVSVDVICTPTRVIRVPCPVPKPSGIYWDLLSPEKLSQVRVLQKLKGIIEAQTGKALPSGPSEKLPPLAERNGLHGRGGSARGRGGRGKSGAGGATGRWQVRRKNSDQREAAAE